MNGIVLLRQENGSHHWSASPIRDPRPRRSLRGAMQQDHRREAPRPRTGYRATTDWTPLSWCGSHEGFEVKKTVKLLEVELYSYTL